MFNLSKDGVFFEGTPICGWLRIDRIVSDEDGRFFACVAFRDRAGRRRNITEKLEACSSSKFVKGLIGRGLRIFDVEKTVEYFQHLLSEDTLLECSEIKTDSEKIIDSIREFIQKNEAGFRSSNVFTPSVQLGYRIKKDKHDLWAFTGDSLARVASYAGINAVRAAKLLNESGFLFINDPARLKASVMTPLGNLRLYCIKHKILEDFEPEFDDVKYLDKIAEAPETRIPAGFTPISSDETTQECGFTPISHEFAPKMEPAETPITAGFTPNIPNSDSSFPKTEKLGQTRIPMYDPWWERWRPIKPDEDALKDLSQQGLLGVVQLNRVAGLGVREACKLLRTDSCLVLEQAGQPCQPYSRLPDNYFHMSLEAQRNEREGREWNQKFNSRSSR